MGTEMQIPHAPSKPVQPNSQHLYLNKHGLHDRNTHKIEVLQQELFGLKERSMKLDVMLTLAIDIIEFKQAAVGGYDQLYQQAAIYLSEDIQSSIDQKELIEERLRVVNDMIEAAITMLEELNRIDNAYKNENNLYYTDAKQHLEKYSEFLETYKTTAKETEDEFNAAEEKYNEAAESVQDLQAQKEEMVNTINTMKRQIRDLTGDTTSLQASEDNHDKNIKAIESELILEKQFLDKSMDELEKAQEAFTAAGKEYEDDAKLEEDMLFEINVLKAQIDATPNTEDPERINLVQQMAAKQELAVALQHAKANSLLNKNARKNDLEIITAKLNSAKSKHSDLVATQEKLIEKHAKITGLVTNNNQQIVVMQTNLESLNIQQEELLKNLQASMNMREAAVRLKESTGTMMRAAKTSFENAKAEYQKYEDDLNGVKKTLDNHDIKADISGKKYLEELTVRNKFIEEQREEVYLMAAAEFLGSVILQFDVKVADWLLYVKEAGVTQPGDAW